jgi:hypothetical protein
MTTMEAAMSDIAIGMNPLGRLSILKELISAFMLIGVKNA